MLFASAALGALTWPLVEYLMHRFNGHEQKGKTRFSREHLAHHADPSRFTPTSVKVQMALAVVVPLLALTGWWLGAVGVAFTIGFTAMYGTYEWLHRHLHTHPPRTDFGRWARRHHFHHHFNAPNLNHGVTTALWDRVFGTLAPVEMVRVPRRHAPLWMVDETGELRPEYRDSYRLAGRVRSSRMEVA